MAECNPSVTREESGGGRGWGWGEVRKWPRVAKGSDTSIIQGCEEPGAVAAKGPEALRKVDSVTVGRRDEHRVVGTNSGGAHQLEFGIFSPWVREHEEARGENPHWGVGQRGSLELSELTGDPPSPLVGYLTCKGGFILLSTFIQSLKKSGGGVIIK